MADCIFCKIINKEIPADIVYEDEEGIAFRDIEPKARVHFLIVPKKHVLSADRLEACDKELIGSLVLVAQRIAKEQGVSETGYRLIFNVGRDAGQTVDHLHLHLLGGEKLPFA